MTPGRVSVVMPCYNAAKYLDEAIDSLRNQTYGNIEIMAVNDGSTDETQARLEQQAARDSRVRIFSQKNAGPSAARNAALRQIDGEYVCFLDSDDVFMPEKIERQVCFLGQHPKIDLVYSDYFTGDEQLNLTGLTAIRMTQSDTVEAVALRNWFPPLVPTFRRRLMDAVGEFDESLRMAEDWDFWIRCARKGAFAYLPGPMVIYRTHDDQVHHDLDRMFRAGHRVLKKNFKSDPALYQRALGSWYALHAKARWAMAQHWKSGTLLAFAAFHHKVGAAAARLGASQSGARS